MHPIRIYILTIILGCSLYGQNRNSVQEIVNSVNRDSLLSTVERLQAFGTRYEMSPQQDSAASYIHSLFSNRGLQTESDWYVFGTHYLMDADLVTEDSIWIVGERGAILFSSTGGTTWEVRSSPQYSGDLNGIDMQPNGLGIAVGGDGTILRTTDAGEHWTISSYGTFSTVTSVSFGTPTTGVIVGADGTILRTTNGGISWTGIASGTDQYFREVRFISPSTAIAVGDSGYILRSGDAGKTWKKQSSGVDASLHSLSFPDSLCGFICGLGSVVLKTTDGGLTWTQPVFPPTLADYLRGIFFSDSLHGWVIDGFNARMFSTVDGGLTWQQSFEMLSTPWGPNLFSLNGIAGQRMLVTGSRSLLLTNDDGGTMWTNITSTLPMSVLHESRNIVATIPGSLTPEIECVLVAHYDSYSDNPLLSAPGANDNATGTAAVMEAARIFSQYTFASTLKLIAVSAEEFGMYGSEHYAVTAKRENRNIKGAVNADMLGYPDKSDTLHFSIGSFESINWLVDSAIIYNQRYGIGLNTVADIEYMGASDYGSFARVGYDALELAEATPMEIWSGDRDPYYHTVNDLASTLNFGLVRRGAQLMLATGAEIAGVLGRIQSVETTDNGHPSAYRLEQNYPNPFNPITNIRYQVPQPGHIELKVFDVMGREVSTLVDGFETPGYKTVQFNAVGLASGVYYYRFQAGMYVETKKLLLLR